MTHWEPDDASRPSLGFGSARVTERSSSTSARWKSISSATNSATPSWPRSKHTEKLGEVDVIIRVHGGGFTGQADACKLGIARALKKFDPELEEALRDSDLLTRDSRMVERKKPGLRGARRGTQFSKR